MLFFPNGRIFCYYIRVMTQYYNATTAVKLCNLFVRGDLMDQILRVISIIGMYGVLLPQ